LFPTEGLSRQGFVEVAGQVFGTFEADRQADHVWAGAGSWRCSSVSWRWVVEAGCRIRLRVSPILARWENSWDVFDELGPGFVAAFDAEGEDRTGASRQVFPGEVVERALLQSGVETQATRG